MILTAYLEMFHGSILLVLLVAFLYCFLAFLCVALSVCVLVSLPMGATSLCSRAQYLQSRNYQLSKSIVHEIKFGDRSVM